MKRVCLILLISITICSQGLAQTASFNAKSTAKRKIQYASFTLHAPLFAFAKSHIAGAGLDYGLMFGKKPVVKFAFTLNAGIDYYLGEKKEIAAHDFTYGGYLNTYIHPGLIWYVYQKGFLLLSAGPEMGIYKGSSDYGAGARLVAGFYLGQRFVLGPGMTFKKQSGADALWTAIGRLSYYF